MSLTEPAPPKSSEPISNISNSTLCTFSASHGNPAVKLEPIDVFSSTAVQNGLVSGGDEYHSVQEHESKTEKRKYDYYDCSEVISINSNANAKRLKPSAGTAAAGGTGQRKVLIPLRNSVTADNGPTSAANKKVALVMPGSSSQSLLQSASPQLPENKPPGGSTAVARKSQPLTSLINGPAKPVYMRCKLPDGRIMLVMKKNTDRVLKPPGSVSLLGSLPQASSSRKPVSIVPLRSRWSCHPLIFLPCDNKVPITFAL